MLLYSTDPKLSPAHLFWLYCAHFQIGFAFRDTDQHLGLNDCQARLQARLHFHFNTVWARLQAEGPLAPFSLRNLKHYNLEEEIHKRIGAGSAPGRNTANTKAGRRRISPDRLWLRSPPLESGPAGP